MLLASCHSNVEQAPLFLLLSVQRGDARRQVGIVAARFEMLLVVPLQQVEHFPLLADFWPHGKVAQDYGVFNAKAGFALRGTFLVDKTGQVVARFEPKTAPGAPEVKQAVAKAIGA